MPTTPDPAGRVALSPALASALTFLAAGTVLVLEIAAGRLLAPYVGVSLTTYSGIIGVILAGIALGAWAGGRIADRGQPARLLGPTFVAGGLAAMAGVPVVDVVGGLGMGGDPVAIVVLAAVGFVAPAAILSAIGPLIVRASLVDLASSGSLVGRLSAIATVGAISGTFVTGFVLLGLVPTRLLIGGAGGVLVLVGIGLIAGARGRGTIGSGALAVGGLLLVGGATLRSPEPCDRESAYFCMQVVTSPTDPTGRTLVLDRVSHAFVDLADPTELGFRYVGWFADASADLVAARQERLEALHIGGGGFTFPRYLAATAPDSRHTVLELDAEVVAIAQERLGFAPTERIAVRVGDARLGIAGVPTASVDLVVGDAFGGLSVPWHLTTREFLVEVDRALRPDGRYLMNLIDGPRQEFVRAEIATLRTIWQHVVVIAAPSTLAGQTGGNVVLLGSHDPLDLASLGRRLQARDGGRVAILSDGAALDRLTEGATVLTDDFAPVDQLLVD